MTWSVDGVKYLHERAISTQQTGFSLVAQMRSWLPDPVGGVVWFGYSNPAMTTYVPVYAGVTDVPEDYRTDGRTTGFSRRSAWWVPGVARRSPSGGARS